MKAKRFIAIAVAGAFAIPLACAEGSRHSQAGKMTSSSAAGAKPAFQDLDENRDGYLSKAEVSGTSWAKDFARLDTNHDGKLSRQEYAAAQENKGAAVGGSSRK